MSRHRAYIPSRRVPVAAGSPQSHSVVDTYMDTYLSEPFHVSRPPPAATQRPSPPFCSTLLSHPHCSPLSSVCVSKRALRPSCPSKLLQSVSPSLSNASFCAGGGMPLLFEISPLGPLVAMWPGIGGALSARACSVDAEMCTEWAASSVRNVMGVQCKFSTKFGSLSNSVSKPHKAEQRRG